MRRSVLGVLSCGVLAACAVTNTGNPNTGSDSAPEGITLVRSPLARNTNAELTDAHRAQFASDQRKLAFLLYGVLGNDGANLFFSPYSITTALAMTYAGAQGETKTEMASALSFSLPEPALHDAFNATDLALAQRSQVPPMAGGDGFELNITNASFLLRGLEIRPAFLDVLARNYDAGMYLADFRATPERERMAINEWVYDRTEERIDELLPPLSIDGDTVFVLVNAIYFKASWQSKFDPQRTQEKLFHGPTGDKSVRMMHGTAFEYTRGADYQAVQLPYLSEEVKMILILPDEGKHAQVEAGLEQGLFDEARNVSSEWEVDLELPRFGFSSEFKLKDALVELGMQSAFSTTADFSGIAGPPGDIFLAEVHHQAYLAVDEEGTEAAAATAVVGTDESDKQPVSVHFDRPFIFVIYDRSTEQILFAGRLSEP